MVVSLGVFIVSIGSSLVILVFIFCNLRVWKYLILWQCLAKLSKKVLSHKTQELLKLYYMSK